MCEFQDVGAALPPTSETGNLNLLCHRRWSGQKRAGSLFVKGRYGERLLRVVRNPRNC